jgi:hypothetical protein
MFITDKTNYNNPVNITQVSGIYVPDTPSKKSGKYYIRFIIGEKNDIYWFYETKEQRDYIYDNYIFPRFIKLIGDIG